MRFLLKAVVLGLAGFGLYKAWELVSPKIGLAQEKTAHARDHVEPALRDAVSTVGTASRDAVASVADASVSAAETVTHAVVDLGEESPTAGTSPSAGTPSALSTNSDPA